MTFKKKISRTAQAKDTGLDPATSGLPASTPAAGSASETPSPSNTALSVSPGERPVESQAAGVPSVPAPKRGGLAMFIPPPRPSVFGGQTK